MSLRWNPRLGAWILGIAVVLGCGGGGSNQGSGPNGVFSGALTNRGDGDQVDLDLNVTQEGVVVDSYARLTSAATGDIFNAPSSHVTGTWTNAVLDLRIDFGAYGVLTMNASLITDQWTGNYQLTKPLGGTETGTIALARVRNGTVNMTGKWGGDYIIESDGGGGGTWEFIYTQSSGDLTFTGNVDGNAVTGIGSVVGDDAVFQFESGGVTVLWRGRFANRAASGEFATSDGVTGTFTGTKR